MSPAKAPLLINRLNICLALFMPLSLPVEVVMGRVAAPYPTDGVSAAVFAGAYVLVGALAFALLRKGRK